MKTTKLLFLSACFMLLGTFAGAQVNFPVPCKASFTVNLDSLTSHPFLYHFLDNSSGDINTWHWDFGDGQTSTERNPSHQYDTEGNYQICLTVSNTNHPDSCSDQICHGILTANYLSLGGLVYAGEYPLNNPLPQGDTGVAAIYRVNDNMVSFVEENYFSDYGYYWFGYVLPGKYLVKISLTQHSTHYGQYFSTYLGNKVNWNLAEIISMENANLYEEAVSLLPVQQLTAGPGSIRGFVNFEQGWQYEVPPISQTTVILADKNKVPLIYVYPDPAGYFHFENLPVDTYFISADATGKPSTTVMVTLTEEAPAADGINLTIFGGNVSGLPDDLTSGFSVARIYPNPIREDLYAEVFSPSNMQVGVRISDMLGNSYYLGSFKVNPGLNHLRIPVSGLSRGVYILTLNPPSASLPVAVKFVR